MVKVPMAQDDEFNVKRRQAESAHVLAQTVRCHARVEQQVVIITAARHGDQHREPVLGQRDVVCFASVEHIGRQPGRSGGRQQPVPVDRTLIGKQQIGAVVYQRGQSDSR